MLQRVECCIPTHERPFFCSIVEQRAYAERRRDESPEGRTQWTDDPQLPFRGVVENGGTNGQSE
jgi:hypothetical protein